MRNKNRILAQERLAGLLFVLVLHGAALYWLWNCRSASVPVITVTSMVELIDLPVPDKPQQPVPSRPKPRVIEPARPQQIAVPAQLSDEPVAALPTAPAVNVPPQPAVVSAVAPPSPVAHLADLSASCPERSPPDYPPLSVRLNEQGRVLLQVALDADGRISGVSFVSHSGFARLDEAALNAVKSWRCRPAMRGGVAVAAVALQPFDFIMEGR